VYLVTGLSSLVVSPFIGRMSDRLGALPVFYVGCVVTVVMVLIYTHLGPSPLALLIAVNLVMFVGIFSRLIPWQALVSGIPAPEQRGAFSAINSAMQQLAGGVASLVAGHIVTLGANGEVQNFQRVGYVVISTTLMAAALIRIVARQKRQVH
jgi:predicted MFS family arabinose efflux permease